jgi:hypothetical protein
MAATVAAVLRLRLITTVVATRAIIMIMTITMVIQGVVAGLIVWMKGI